MWNKQISQAAIIILDQTVVLKRKFSRPKISAEKFIHSKEASEQKKRDLYMFEINVKQSPQQFLLFNDLNRASKVKNIKGSLRAAMNTDELEEAPMQI